MTASLGFDKRSRGTQSSDRNRSSSPEPQAHFPVAQRNGSRSVVLSTHFSWQVSSSSSLSPPLPCRPITQKKGSPIPTSTAAVLPIQTRWAWKAAAAKTIIQPGIPKCFNQPFNNVLAGVFSLLQRDGRGQRGWTTPFWKSALCCPMDCLLLFYMDLFNISQATYAFSTPSLSSSRCSGTIHCSQPFMPSVDWDYISIPLPCDFVALSTQTGVYFLIDLVCGSTM